MAKDEFQAWEKIYHDALKEKRSAGSVCVYLVAPDGKRLASMIVSTAAAKDNLLKLLRSTVDRLQVTGGQPVVTPVCQAPAPPVGSAELLLYLVARADHRYSWGEFPSENWIVLKEDAWKAWLPASPAKGTTYDIPASAANKLLTYFFPQTEICNFGKALAADGPYKHRVENMSLKGRVLDGDKSLVTIRLDGRVKLKHTFYPDRDDANFAASTFVGYIVMDRASNRVVRLSLATSDGHYGRFGFSVAVRTETKK